MKNEKRALWLEKDGKVSLFKADDVDGAKSSGWAEPKTVRGNGEPWNPDVHAGEGLAQAESAVIVAEGIKAVDEAKAKRLAKGAEDALKVAESVRTEPAPDLRVEVVEPKKGKAR